MPYPAAAVANTFIALADKRGRELTHMQLQKLLYFAHGWHLGLEEGPLCEEHAQAWEYGPVFPSLYQDLKRWGKHPVEEPITKTYLTKGRLRAHRQEHTPYLPDADEFALAVVNKVWELYGPLSGFELSAISHDAKGPWARMRKETIGKRNVDIPNHMIETYFAGQRTSAS